MVPNEVDLYGLTRNWTRSVRRIIMPKVLIADDSLSVRKVAERLLIAAGFDVALAANGEEALACFTASQPDVLIADVIMPDKSGFEVCAYVRAHATLSATPVLLISGVVDEEITRQAVACRADGVIKKPFHGTSLRDRVFALLAARQASLPPAGPTPLVVPKPPDVVNIGGAAPPLKISGITEDHLKNVRPADTENIFVVEDVETRMSELEEQNSAFRETAFSDTARIRDLEVTLGEEQKHVRELEEQNSALRETALSAAAGIGELQVTFVEKHKHVGVLEEQNSALRESASSTAVRIRELEVIVEAQQTRSAMLLDRIAAMEHAASCAQRLADILAEIGRLGPKP
jgi:CheY-like chemotaxis protein